MTSPKPIFRKEGVRPAVLILFLCSLFMLIGSALLHKKNNKREQQLLSIISQMNQQLTDQHQQLIQVETALQALSADQNTIQTTLKSRHLQQAPTTDRRLLTAISQLDHLVQGQNSKLLRLEDGLNLLSLRQPASLPQTEQPEQELPSAEPVTETYEDGIQTAQRLVRDGITLLQHQQYSQAKQKFAQALRLNKNNNFSRAYYALASFEENPLSAETEELINWCQTARYDETAGVVATLALATIFKYQQNASESKTLYQQLLTSGYQFTDEEREHIVNYING